MSLEEQTINERLLSLENEMRTLKMGTGTGTGTGTGKKEKKEKSDKKPREPTEYNKFVSAYINEQKEKLGDTFNHKVAFSGAATKWNEQKKLKEKN